MKSSVDQSIALETLMLCSTNKDNDFASFRGKDKENFIEFYNDQVDTEKIEIIKTAILYSVPSIITGSAFLDIANSSL